MYYELEELFEDEIVSIEIVLNYLSRMIDMPKHNRFKEIGIEKIVESIDHYVSFEDKDLCSLIDKLMASLKEAELCYEMASNVSWADIKKYGKIIIDSKDIENNYYFALNIEGSDVLGHGNVVIESKDPEYNYLFAKYVKGANVLGHGQAVIMSADIWYNYLFAKEVIGADVKGHGSVIIDSKDLHYNYTFAEEIDDCDTKRHCDVLLDSDKREFYVKKVQEDTQYHLYPYFGIERAKVKEKGINKKN